MAIECKWEADAFEPRGLSAFRASYPKGRNLVVHPRPGRSRRRRVAGLDVEVLSLGDLRAALTRT